MADSRLNEIYKVVELLMDQKPDVDDFLEPVDWKGLGLTDYPDLIANPMDLGTIMQKFAEARYRNHAEVAMAADARESVRMLFLSFGISSHQSYLSYFERSLFGFLVKLGLPIKDIADCSSTMEELVEFMTHMCM